MPRVSEHRVELLLLFLSEERFSCSQHPTDRIEQILCSSSTLERLMLYPLPHPVESDGSVGA